MARAFQGLWEGTRSRPGLLGRDPTLARPSSAPRPGAGGRLEPACPPTARRTRRAPHQELRDRRRVGARRREVALLDGDRRCGAATAPSELPFGRDSQRQYPASPWLSRSSHQQAIAIALITVTVPASGDSLMIEGPRGFLPVRTFDLLDIDLGSTSLASAHRRASGAPPTTAPRW